MTHPTHTTDSHTRRIDEIIIGERHRFDMGDVDGLMASIAAIGLLNAITVDENGCLLAGARRLAACKRACRVFKSGL
jgi:ParB family chromosome partitioning protein